jgi:hypothetical protein
VSLNSRERRRLDGTGGDVDIVAALFDMIAYNGGKPLSCYA